MSYVVDRAGVNSTTQYIPEAPAEGLYQVGLFTSALSDLYHGYFSKKKSGAQDYDYEVGGNSKRYCTNMMLFYYP